MTDKQLTDLIIAEIRENRRDIGRVKDSLWSFKVKVAPVFVIISVLISIGLSKWLLI